MKLSIIITVYNTRGLLRQLLKGLIAHPPNTPHEIIVVDNASIDGVATMMQNEFPHVLYFKKEKNEGLAKGNNFGIKKSQGDYLLILNSDIAVFDGEIDTLVRFMDNHEKAGIVAPQLLHPDKTLQLSTFTYPKWYIPILRRTPLGKLPQAKRELQKYMMKDWDHAQIRKVDWVLGAAMLIRKNALSKVGLQDEDYFLYFEDVDWCQRFAAKGYEVWYTPESKFIHYHKRESAENPGLKGIFSTLTKIHIRSWITYLKKNSRKIA